MDKCPGQDQRFWKVEDIFEIDCPRCGSSVEFWKDEPKLKCPSCKGLITNPKLDLSCAKWCKYASECLGTLTDADNSILCDILIEEMKTVFGDDKKRINHALEVLKYAELIHLEQSGDPLVVKAAAILHDIGIHESERKYNSSACNYQEIEGPPIAKEILIKHGLEPDTIEHICRIIANHHSAKDIDTDEFRIIWDADWLVNIPDEYHGKNKEELKELIDKIFKTDKGRKLAEELFL